jgi:5,10-methylene-tetrahydrofolate dehydrogenase/methenyl tetrahydrofolate cyclohydrolase
MAGIKIDGTAIAKEIREKLHAQIDEQLKTNPRYHPSLKIIQGEKTPERLNPAQEKKKTDFHLNSGRPLRLQHICQDEA